MLVGLDNAIDTIDLGVKDVTIEREAVVSIVGVRRDGRAESQDRNLFVSVIILEDVAN